MPLTSPLDHEYFIDKHGIIFCVIGYSHPPHKIIAYPKYMPAFHSNELWIRGTIHYRRITKYYTPKEIRSWGSYLKQVKAFYEEYDYFYNTQLIKVPKEAIMEYLEPKKGLNNIIHHGPQDHLEHKALNLVFLLAQNSGLPTSSFGISGSILLRMHHERSDIDIIVYGLRGGWLVKQAIIELSKQATIMNLPRPEVEKTLTILCKNCGIPYEHAVKVVKRRWRRGVYEGTLFSITPVFSETEVLKYNVYGKRIYRNVKPVTIDAEVTNNTLSIIYPSIYEVKVQRVYGAGEIEAKDIKYIVSYNSIFLGLFDVGERVKATGILQQVIDLEDNITYYHVLIGSREEPGFIVTLE